MRHLLWKLGQYLRWFPAAPGAMPPTRRDLVLTGVVSGAAALEAAYRTDLADRWWALALVISLALLLPCRRVAPAGVLAVVTAASWLVTTFRLWDEGWLYSLVAVLLLPYALFRWGSGRSIVGGTVWTVMLVGVFGQVGGPGDQLAGALLAALLAALGIVVRQRAAARARELEQARLLERERLARDLHDTVAHHVSAIAVCAQAGLAQTSPAASGEALRLIVEEASATLAQMRSVVHLLREDGASAVTDLLRLATPAQGEHAAVVVELGDDLDDVPADAAAALYRVAQEAVTNARRHAHGATHVRVRLHADGPDVRLTVEDDGAPVWLSAEGFGLRGMRERVELLRGEFTAGPGTAGGWTVEAAIPVGGHG